MVTAAKTTTDLVKERPQHFRAGAIPSIVQLAPARYVTLEGGGVPASTEGRRMHFQASIRVLSAVAESIKARCQQEGRDFKVAPVEASWCAYHCFGDCRRDFPEVDGASWRWKAMIMLPDFVDEAVVEAAKAEQRDETGFLQHIRFEIIDQGLCLQALHSGPYDEQHETIRAMRRFMERERLRACGLHHEVYLNDPKRTAPEKLRLILRQPVRPIEDPTTCPEDDW